MNETEATTRPVEDEIDQEVIDDESSVFAELVPKDEDGLAKEIEESQDPADRMQLIRYDPLRHYLLEISKYEPLNQDEERRLAHLLRDHQDRDAARRLVTSNLKLVVKVGYTRPMPQRRSRKGSGGGSPPGPGRGQGRLLQKMTSPA